MLKSSARGLLLIHIFLLILSNVSANDNDFSRCNCDDEDSMWINGRIIDCQRVSDFLIAVAYLSIPIELLYFVSCSNVPFKWVLFEFILFIVLCGLTHLLNGWTYGPHPFPLILALTIFKILTALVSCATAITLFTLIPLLLKVKVREFMLKKKTWDLGREFGIIMKQKEAGLHVRMLTRVIRNSLDRHTILDTTLKELSKTLMLQNCAVWMPNELRTMMNLTHVSHSDYSDIDNCAIPVSDPDVVRIEKNEGVNFLRPDSVLAAASSGGSGDPGPVAAIRMPMLRVSNFRGGTPEMIQQCYAILVLVLPFGQRRMWSTHELEIVKVVADQVAVALSHAAILEESQLMREKLQVQNRALQQAEMKAMMASQARITFQNVMSDGMKKPMHSILGLISLMQDENLSKEQRLIVDAMMKAGKVLVTLLNDVMEISTTNSGRFALEMKPFDMHAILKEGACTAKWLCAYAGAKFSADIDKSIPCIVLGDEKRLMQLILRMMVNMLNGNVRDETVIFRVTSEKGSEGSNYGRVSTWNQCMPEGDLCIRFEMEKGINTLDSDGPNSGSKGSARRSANDAVEDGLGFSVCKKIVKMMQGNIWIIPDAQGFPRSTGMVLRFQHQAAMMAPILEYGDSADNPHSNSILRGLHVLLADADNLNRVVTKKCLQKLGCRVTAVESGIDCLSAVTPASSQFRIVLLDLQISGWDGFEIATRIRKFRSHSRPLIIALTASFDENIYKKCQHVGMNGMIRKPVMLKGIAKELRRVILQATN